MQNKIIGFIGGGNMAASLIGGLVATGHDPERILVAEPDQAKRDQLTAEHGVGTMTQNDILAAQADVLVLAVKPNIMPSVLAQIAAPIQVRKPLVISIAAGLPMRLYRDALGEQVPLVRAMPNTPSLVRAGITGAVLEAAGRSDAKTLATAVLGAVGEVRWLPADADLDLLTAVSGSGPAYFFYLMEAMQRSAEAMGMDAELARDLVLHTAYGAAKLALRDPATPAELRARVTSPGGTTAKAVEAMQQGRIPEVMDNAMRAVVKRAQEMAQEA